jgi:uncharacterized surface protein with fasciclin (FAS1) repeats
MAADGPPKVLRPGKSVSIETSGGGVKVNGAKVVKADIECANGVIHVIDTLLVPKS